MRLKHLALAMLSVISIAPARATDDARKQACSMVINLHRGIYERHVARDARILKKNGAEYRRKLDMLVAKVDDLFDDATLATAQRFVDGLIDARAMNAALAGRPKNDSFIVVMKTVPERSLHVEACLFEKPLDCVRLPIATEGISAEDSRRIYLESWHQADLELAIGETLARYPTLDDYLRMKLPKDCFEPTSGQEGCSK